VLIQSYLKSSYGFPFPSPFHLRFPLPLPQNSSPNIPVPTLALPILYPLTFGESRPCPTCLGLKPSPSGLCQSLPLLSPVGCPCLSSSSWFSWAFPGVAFLAPRLMPITAASPTLEAPFPLPEVGSSGTPPAPPPRGTGPRGSQGLQCWGHQDEVDRVSARAAYIRALLLSSRAFSFTFCGSRNAG
jgi:hypothetical protein